MAAARLTREQRREQLLAVGMEMVADSSFDELSVDDVADEAGISRSLLFHYFPSKSDYMVALAEQAAAELLAAIAPDPGLPVDLALRSSLESYLDYVTERGDAYRALVRGASGRTEEMQTVFDRTRRAVADLILDALGADPASAPPRLRLAALGAVAYVEQVAISWLADPRLDRGELLRLLEDSLSVFLATLGEPAA